MRWCPPSDSCIASQCTPTVPRGSSNHQIRDLVQTVQVHSTYTRTNPASYFFILEPEVAGTMSTSLQSFCQKSTRQLEVNTEPNLLWHYGRSRRNQRRDASAIVSRLPGLRNYTTWLGQPSLSLTKMIGRLK